MTEQEIWKVCPTAEFFEVSSKGNVRNTKRKVTLKPSNNGTGYRYVTKVIGDKKKHFYVHRLVAMTFLDNSDNLPEVNHKDGDKSNNCADNLEWCTRSENQHHAHRTGLKKPYEKQREVARENGRKNVKLMLAGWRKWYATEEGRKKHAENARANITNYNREKLS